MKLISKIVGVTLGLAMAVGAGVGVAANRKAAPVFADDVVYYTLTPEDGSNNTYDGDCDVPIEAISTDASYYAGNNYSVTWNIVGNSTMQPWRLGGKKISDVDRTVYSKTAMSSAITKIDLTVGSATITVNSLKLLVCSDASFENEIDEVTVTYSASTKLTIQPTNTLTEWATGAYYKFIFNVTNTTNSNKYAEFTKAEFYAAESGGDPEVPTLSSISVSTVPTKTTYNAGECFDPTGLVIGRTYSDASSDTYSYAGHTEDFTFTPNTTTRLTTSNTSVSIAYGGKAVSQAITVNSASEPVAEEKTLNEFKALPNNAYRAYSVTAFIKEFNSGATKHSRGTLTLTDGVNSENDLKVYRSTLSASALVWNGNNASYSYNDPNDFVSNQRSNNLEVGTEITMKLIRADYNSEVQANGVITWIELIEATAISLDKDTATVDINDTVELIPTFTPSNATSEVVWLTSNNGIANVSNGVVTGVSAGTATITAKVSDSVKAECVVTVTNIYLATLKSNSDSDDAKANSYTGDGLAEILNLNPSLFTVTYDKNGAGNEMAIRTDGIRMYATKETSNGNKFTVSIGSGYKIKEISIQFDSEAYGAQAVISSTKSNSITADEGVYTINDSQFTVFDDNSNVSTENKQVRFQKISIRYKVAAAVEVSNLTTQPFLSYKYTKTNENYSFSSVTIRFRAIVNKTLLDELEAESNVTSFGVLLTTDSFLTFMGVNDLKDFYGSADNIDVFDFVSAKNMPSLLEAADYDYLSEDSYCWNFRKDIDTSGTDEEDKLELMEEYVAVAYVVTEKDGVIFLNQNQPASAKSLAQDAIDNGGYNASSFDGSLGYLANLN